MTDAAAAACDHGDLAVEFARVHEISWRGSTAKSSIDDIQSETRFPPYQRLMTKSFVVFPGLRLAS